MIIGFCFSELQKSSLVNYCSLKESDNDFYLITEKHFIISRCFFGLDRAILLVLFVVFISICTYAFSNIKLFLGDCRRSRIQRIALLLARFNSILIGLDGTGTLIWLRENRKYIKLFVDRCKYDFLLTGGLEISNDEISFINPVQKQFLQNEPQVVVVGQPFVEVELCTLEEYNSALAKFKKKPNTAYAPHRREKNEIFIRNIDISVANSADVVVGFSSTYFIELLLDKCHNVRQIVLLPIPENASMTTQARERFDEAVAAKALIIKALNHCKWIRQ